MGRCCKPKSWQKLPKLIWNTLLHKVFQINVCWVKMTCIHIHVTPFIKVTRMATTRVKALICHVKQTIHTIGVQSASRKVHFFPWKPKLNSISKGSMQEEKITQGTSCPYANQNSHHWETKPKGAKEGFSSSPREPHNSHWPVAREGGEGSTPVNPDEKTLVNWARRFQPVQKNMSQRAGWDQVDLKG